MKQYLILFLSILFFSCSSDSDELIKEATIKIDFSQNWDSETIDKSRLSDTDLELTNKLGTKLRIEKLRYLISRITLTDALDKATVLTELKDGKENAYKLIDLSDTESLTFTSSDKISEGTYNLAMTFGFNDEDHTDGIYQDLNTASWGVPGMLGGGYHFMQLEGKFLNNNPIPEQQGFAYHTIRAYNSTTNEPEDTSFTIDLGTIQITNNATIEIKMNIAEWFKNPNEWDLNELNSMLMPNYEAQKLMSANGKSGVFSLGTITQ
jgi:hypothetical protein